MNRQIINEEVVSETILTMKIIRTLFTFSNFFSFFAQDSSRKTAILQELQQQIIEINAEQKYVVMQLQQLIDNFFAEIQIKNSELTNSVIDKYNSLIIVPAASNSNLHKKPVNVMTRLSEDGLIQRYFKIIIEETALPTQDAGNTNSLGQGATGTSTTIQDNTINNSENVGPVELSKHRTLGLDSRNTMGNKTENPPEKNIAQHTNAVAAAHITPQNGISSLKNIPQHCMNLRSSRKEIQNAALPANLSTQKGFSGRANPKVAERGQYSTAASTSATIDSFEASTSSSINSIGNEIKKRPLAKGRRGFKTTKTSSSSEENSDSVNAPQELMYPEKIKMTRCTPLEFSQNEFLRLFDLCTSEEFAELKRRRSQRRRRSVKSSRHSDYIYEMPEVGSPKMNY